MDAAPRPLDDPGPTTSGEPRAFFYARYAHPTRRRGRGAARRARGRRGAALRLGDGGRDRRRARARSPGATVALAAGRVLRHRRALRRARALGPSLRRVRPDRPAAAGRRSRLGRGAGEPAADDAGLERRRRTRRPSSATRRAATPVYLRPLDDGADLVVHSATKYLTATTTCCSGAVARDPGDTERLREFRTRTGIVAAPDAAWLLLRGLDDARGPHAAAHRDARTELAARLSRPPAVERSATPASAA